MPLFALHPIQGVSKKQRSTVGNWRRFEKLVRLLPSFKINAKRKRQLLDDFYLGCTSEESNLYLKSLRGELGHWIGRKILNSIWPELDLEFVPPSFGKHGSIGSGIEIFISVNKYRVAAISRNGRSFPVLAELFGTRLAKVCREGIFHGFVSSKNWPLTEAMLNSKVKSITESERALLLKDLRLTLIGLVSKKWDKRARAQKLNAIWRKLKRRRLNKNTSLDFEALKSDLISEGPLPKGEPARVFRPGAAPLGTELHPYSQLGQSL